MFAVSPIQLFVTVVYTAFTLEKKQLMNMHTIFKITDLGIFLVELLADLGRRHTPADRLGQLI